MSDSIAERFRRFHERLGKPLFAPDFLDSLARVAADAESCLGDRVLALAKLRAWGNQNEYAIRIESDGTAQTLTQQDFAWDLAWLETGIRWEWLDAPPSTRAAETARLGVKPIDKTSLSRAVRLNELRGTISKAPGRQIEPVVSPNLVRSFERRLDRSREFQEFLEVFKVEHSGEFEELEPATRLAALRSVFPDEYLSSASLDAVDQGLTSLLCGDYDPESFVAFVAARQRKGRISAGLVFDLEKGLPCDFVHKVREEAAVVRAVAVAEEREHRQREQQWAEFEVERLKAALTDPFSPPSDIACARTRPELAHFDATDADRRNAFDRRVTDALDGLGRSGSADYRAECAALLARAAEIDPLRLSELKAVPKRERARWLT